MTPSVREAKMKDHKDLPLDEWARKADELITAGCVVWAKFTCLHCGARQTADTPNGVCTGGYSCEECRQISYPEKFGMIVMMVIPPKEEKETP